jgi:hypothetical protein
VSLAESFLNTAKELLMMAENIKRAESRVDKLTEEMRGLDRRVMKIELMVDLAKEEAKARSPKRLT